MAFNIEFYNKEHNVIDFNRLDEEVCELWHVAPDDVNWATPPGKDYDHNWNEFLGRAVFLTRAFKETGTFKPSDLLQGLCTYGGMHPSLESIDKWKYEIQLLLFWMQKDYRIVVTNG